VSTYSTVVAWIGFLICVPVTIHVVRVMEAPSWVRSVGFVATGVIALFLPGVFLPETGWLAIIPIVGIVACVVFLVITFRCAIDSEINKWTIKRIREKSGTRTRRRSK